MDNVLVDFKSGLEQFDQSIKDEYYEREDEIPGIFGKMKPLEGAIESYIQLSKIFDTFILSTSPWENETASMDKLRWVKKYLGDVAYKRLILTHHKNLNRGHFLIDDRDKNGVKDFKGTHIHFGPGKKYPDWKSVVEYLKDKG
jgi:5'(3')-deoxyribonucleotidase